jgi:hypothetical protein
MPKATVDEHRQPFAGKRDVDAAPRHARNLVPDAVAESSGMKDAAQCVLRCRTRPSLRPHPGTDERRRRVELGHGPSQARSSVRDINPEDCGHHLAQLAGQEGRHGVPDLVVLVGAGAGEEVVVGKRL